MIRSCSLKQQQICEPADVKQTHSLQFFSILELGGITKHTPVTFLPRPQCSTLRVSGKQNSVSLGLIDAIVFTVSLDLKVFRVKQMSFVDSCQIQLRLWVQCNISTLPKLLNIPSTYRCHSNMFHYYTTNLIDSVESLCCPRFRYGAAIGKSYL